MMTAKELVIPIEFFAPPALQEGWDNCGFSVGDPYKEVNKALIALDCTEEVIDEAVEAGADILITHHPLILGGIKQITPLSITGRIIERAVKNNIAVYSAHTNMDKVANGVSSIMADKLDLRERDFITADGFGIVGNMPVPCKAESLAGLVKEKFSVGKLRVSSPLDCEIKRVAVCGGSGKSFIKDAMSRGAQVYITGDMTYHDFYCEKGFMVMDIGHYASEYDIVKLFAAILCKNFPNFAVSISRKNNNPIYYY